MRRESAHIPVNHEFEAREIMEGWRGYDSLADYTNLGFVSPCIFVHSNELIPTRCSN